MNQPGQGPGQPGVVVDLASDGGPPAPKRRLTPAVRIGIGVVATLAVADVGLLVLRDDGGSERVESGQTTTTIASTTTAATDTTTTVAGGDGSVLTIRTPADGTTVASADVMVEGSATPGSTVLVNGQPAITDPSGSWARAVPLTAASNPITVVATDPTGNSSTQTITVNVTISLPTPNDSTSTPVTSGPPTPNPPPTAQPPTTQPPTTQPPTTQPPTTQPPAAPTVFVSGPTTVQACVWYEYSLNMANATEYAFTAEGQTISNAVSGTRATIRWYFEDGASTRTETISVGVRGPGGNGSNVLNVSVAPDPRTDFVQSPAECAAAAG